MSPAARVLEPGGLPIRQHPSPMREETSLPSETVGNSRHRSDHGPFGGAVVPATLAGTRLSIKRPSPFRESLRDRVVDDVLLVSISVGSPMNSSLDARRGATAAGPNCPEKVFHFMRDFVGSAASALGARRDRAALNLRSIRRRSDVCSDRDDALLASRRRTCAALGRFARIRVGPFIPKARSSPRGGDGGTHRPPLCCPLMNALCLRFN